MQLGSRSILEGAAPPAPSLFPRAGTAKKTQHRMLTGDGVGAVSPGHASFIRHSPDFHCGLILSLELYFGSLDPDKRLTFSLPSKNIHPAREGSYEVSPLRVKAQHRGVRQGGHYGTEEGHLAQPNWGKRAGILVSFHANAFWSGLSAV